MSVTSGWLPRAGLGLVSLVALVLTATPSAEAGARGCSERTCVDVAGSGPTVDRVSASTTWNGDFTGHFRIWGGGIDQNSATGYWGYRQKFSVPVGRDLPNGSVLCAEGWEHVDGRLESRGRACEEVHF